MLKNSRKFTYFWLIFALATAFALFVFVHPVLAIPSTIDLQGRVTDKQGNQVSDNTYPITFSIYNVSEGGQPIWQESLSVAVTNGLFSVTLGNTNPLANIDFSKGDFYLGINFNNDGEMSPRKKFSSVPFSQTSQTLAGKSSSDFVLKSGDTLTGNLNLDKYNLLTTGKISAASFLQGGQTLADLFLAKSGGTLTGPLTVSGVLGLTDADIPNDIIASNYLPLAGGTLTGSLTVNGVTGLTDADIPNNITASNYLPLAGGTLTGSLTFASGQTFPDTLTIAGGTLTGPLSLQGAASTLSVAGAVTLQGATTISGASTLSGATTISGALVVNSAATFNGSLTTQGVLTANAGLTLSLGTLTLPSASVADAALSAAANDAITKRHTQNTDTSTTSLTFGLGSGTAVVPNNFDLQVSSVANKPALRYNGTAGTWQISNDGTSFADIGIAGGTYVNLQGGAPPGIQQTGNLYISGTATAGTFSGSGASLSSLNASNISSGTLDNARLAASVSLLGQTIEGSEISADTITNSNINSSAAIAYSKVNLSGSIVNADINASAAIAYSKLSLGLSIVNTDISNSAAIAYSKLNLSGSIVNGDISNSAAIADTKLATISTAGKVSDSALSSNVALLNAAETIAADWVNTANPWADNEVADDLTINSTKILQTTLNGEQLRLINNGSNYLSTTVGATGAVTFDANGSGAAFIFSDATTISSLLTASNGLTLSSGSLTLPSTSVADAALSSNVALLNRVGQVFSNTNIIRAATTNQLTVGYDTSNYYTTNVANNGAVTFDATGSGAAFIFSDALTSSGLLTASNGLTLSSGSLTLPSTSVADAALSSNVALLNRTGQIFTGTNTIRSTTANQLTIGYDTNEYFTMDVANGGPVSFNSTSATAPGFKFQDNISLGTAFPDSTIGVSIANNINSGSYYGLYNNLGKYTAGAGAVYGVYNALIDATSSYGGGTAYGVYNDLETVTNGTAYGVYAKSNSSSSTGTIYAYYADLTAGSPATKWGLYLTGASNYLLNNGEQLRIGYDISNYYTTTVGATGGVTFDAVGAGAGFTFSDNINSNLAFANNLTLGTAGGNTLTIGRTNSSSTATINLNNANTTYNFKTTTRVISLSAKDCESVSGAAANNVGYFPVWRFRDAQSDAIRCAFDIPDDWSSGTNMSLVILFSGDADALATPKGVRWDLAGNAVSGQTVLTSSGAFSGTTTFTDYWMVSLRQKSSAISITSSGWTAGDTSVAFSITRNGTDAGDTYAGNADIHLIEISYTATTPKSQ